MILETFISQLRANAPIFGGRVAGAAEFNAGLENYNTSMAMPAAYVIPLGQDAEPNKQYAGGLYQVVHKGIGIAVELTAQPDRRGQAPITLFETIEAQINASVLNLYIGNCRMAQGAYLTGARYLNLDRARLWYQWEFAIDWVITDLDGVQPASVPLEAIEVDIFHAPVTVGELPAAVVQIPTGAASVPPTDGPWPSITTEWDGGGTVWDNDTTVWMDMY